MNRWTRFVAAVILTLMLCAVFGKVLMTYCRPMENTVYDLSLDWAAEAIPDDWVYDQKGWTVFTQEGDAVTELDPDGFGGFYGLDEPGQTFYFSRIIEEELDSPTLRLSAAEQTFSVFLDGTLVYTDCLELDNRIGHLRLPTLEWYREEAVLVKLPLDCAGKTLTIAQSTAPFYEGNRARVYPAAVTLYCGYAYESALISESFQTAIPSALSFAAGLLLLVLFLWQAFQRRLDPGTLCGALAAFSYLSARIIDVSFRYQYFALDGSIVLVDMSSLGRNLTLIMLLIMLLCKLSGWRQAVLSTVTIVLNGMLLVNLILSAQERASIPLILWFSLLGTVGLLLAAVLGLWEWKRRWFFRLFCPLTLAGTLLYVLPASLTGNSATWTIAMFLWPLTNVCVLTALLSTVAEWLHGELARRTEERLLVQRSELARSGYEALRRQHEQVMMLSHDMMKHFQLLRQTTSDRKTAEYLDELMGENEKIRPVVQSGNEMLDIILNGKLSAAADAGIRVELARTNAPAKLPLTDAELCSLVMNLLDNALEAAAGTECPYIRLDLCVREHFFVIFCENSTTLEHIQRETAPEHGLGLKIIKQIAARYDNLLEVEYGTDYYSVKLAIPLN